jgi:hypothetical protein
MSSSPFGPDAGRPFWQVLCALSVRRLQIPRRHCTLKMEAASSPETSVTTHQLHNVISHSTCIFICTAIRISNFAPSSIRHAHEPNIKYSNVRRYTVRISATVLANCSQILLKTFKSTDKSRDSSFKNTTQVSFQIPTSNQYNLSILFATPRYLQLKQHWDFRSSGIWCGVDCSWLPTVRNNLSISSSRVKQSKDTAWHMKMEPIAYPETSVTTNLRCVKCQKTLDLIYTAA